MKSLKKLAALGLVLLGFVMLSPFAAKAMAGDMGFFGGITEGVRLPRTSEVIFSTAAANATLAIDSTYTEIIFINGVPVEFQGLIAVRRNGTVTNADRGTYTVTYTIIPSSATATGVYLNRHVSFLVNWHRERGRDQVHKDFQVQTWVETVTVDGATFTLDRALSFWDVSVLEVHSAGVVYYRGNQTKRAVFNGPGGQTTVEAHGELYGFRSAWAHAESHIKHKTVFNDEWQMHVQIRPSVSAYKTIQYHNNEPFLINFPGNWQEVLITQSGLAYNIIHLPNQFYGIPTYGTASIETPNVFQNLMWVDTTPISAHFAHRDIAQLYAVGVLQRPVAMFQPNERITRSEFFVMLARAINLPLEEIPTGISRRRDLEVLVFADINRDRPDYPYIMALHSAGLTVGRGGSQFRPDDFVTIEEAMHVIINALGLLRLGLESNMTPFADDADISPWARQALYAGARIGLISPVGGYINPQLYLNKGGAAAIVNRLIEYMRFELMIEYTENIVHFSW